MAFYEHVFIARPDISEAQVNTMVKDFSKIIKEHKGNVTKDEYWGLKSLAYKIKKNKKAHYVMFNIDAPHAAVAEMEQKERFDDNVLRFMTIRVAKLDPKPSVMMRAKSDDDYDESLHRKRDNQQSDKSAKVKDNANNTGDE